MSSRLQILSSNMLKIIACVAMLIDHIGVIFFPDIDLLRIIGRIAFPVFAFFIAQGCRYTKNKLRYFLTVFSVGLICQIALEIFTRDAYLNVLITFSFSILICYALEYLKVAIFEKQGAHRICLLSAMLLALITLVAILNLYKYMEYGFFGCMLAPLASLLYMPSNAPVALKRLDKPWICTLIMGIGVVLLAIAKSNYIQWFALLSIPLLFLYSGERGRLKMKYFFYIFYPVHLALLYGLHLLILII